ncbi:hypothetical protein CFOL_v3_16417 [Cephalotus follicularis]|uniref:Uncharacterized protein n=1 Tax=Cephalotus follicularis TaxID=3775 RepID=A0A1Q3BYH2_CEPFO|nr:hypothetical protein CFOL_v3_16417 [Cephalotus follicularis]
MKLTTKKSDSAATFPAFRYHSNDSDLIATATNNDDVNNKPPPRRKTGNPTRLKRVGAPAGRRSRPETPLLKWKTEDRERDRNVGEAGDDESEGRKSCYRRNAKAVSARKIAAGIWRLQLPDKVANSGGGVAGDRRRDRLGFQSGAGHVGIYHRDSKEYGSEAKNPLQNPRSVAVPNNKFLCMIAPSIQFSNSAMEGATKWDPACLNTTDEVQQIYSHMKRIDQQVSAVSVVSALEAELEQARVRIEELETERRTSKKKLEHFLRKISEERAAWRGREHEKICAFIDDMKTDLNRERKNHQRMEIMNSKLVNELADMKLSVKRYMQDYEKERKARELIEEVCDELAKEIGEDKTEVEALKRESMKLREELDEERKMLQMAEVWREERVQMKLVDAKVALEEKYSQMNKLVADLESLLRSRSATLDMEEMRKAELLRQAVSSVNVQVFKEFKYEPPNPDDIFSVFEDVNCGEPKEREIEPCVDCSPANHASKLHTVSPEVNMMYMDNLERHSNVFADENEEIEEDESGWETVSHLEEQGSSYSPDGSPASVNKDCQDSNISGSGTEWEERACEETSITEINEVCSVPKRETRRASSIARLWRSCPSNGDNFKVISVEGMNGRLSNAGIESPDRGSAKGELSPLDMVGQWSSPESGNPHITRGMKGCIEWPRGAQKNSLKSKLLEARMESQKVQLRHVLKQKI